jgi:hypothetical protein
VAGQPWVRGRIGRGVHRERHRRSADNGGPADRDGVAYTVDAVPSMRMIVDLSNVDTSRWVRLTGNSGHAFHPNYDDQFELWHNRGEPADVLRPRRHRGRRHRHADPDPVNLSG